MPNEQVYRQFGKWRVCSPSYLTLYSLAWLTMTGKGNRTITILTINLTVINMLYHLNETCLFRLTLQMNCSLSLLPDWWFKPSDCLMILTCINGVADFYTTPEPFPWGLLVLTPSFRSFPSSFCRVSFSCTAIPFISHQPVETRLNSTSSWWGSVVAKELPLGLTVIYIILSGEISYKKETLRSHII